MAKKLYKFNMERNGHNIDTAMTILRNRMYDATDAGDFAAVERLQARHERIYKVAYESGVWYGRGMLGLEYKDWEFLTTVSNWMKGWRATKCEQAGIEYVE